MLTLCQHSLVVEVHRKFTATVTSVLAQNKLIFTAPLEKENNHSCDNSDEKNSCFLTE